MDPTDPSTDSVKALACSFEQVQRTVFVERAQLRDRLSARQVRAYADGLTALNPLV